MSLFFLIRLPLSWVTVSSSLFENTNDPLMTAENKTTLFVPHLSGSLSVDSFFCSKESIRIRIDDSFNPDPTVVRDGVGCSSDRDSTRDLTFQRQEKVFGDVHRWEFHCTSLQMMIFPSFLRPDETTTMTIGTDTLTSSSISQVDETTTTKSHLTMCLLPSTRTLSITGYSAA